MFPSYINISRRLAHKRGMSAPSADAPGQMPFGPYMNVHTHPRGGGGHYDPLKYIWPLLQHVILFYINTRIPNNIMITAML